MGNPGWAGLKVILSDASSPGEGEHKIMDFIRRQRLQKDYDPQTSHVLYGLDADLIMLAVATHEPHFFILREVVFQPNKPQTCNLCGQTGHFARDCQGKPAEKKEDGSPEGKPYQMVHISVLREYLGEDLPSGRKYELERVLDD